MFERLADECRRTFPLFREPRSARLEVSCRGNSYLQRRGGHSGPDAGFDLFAEVGGQERQSTIADVRARLREPVWSKYSNAPRSAVCTFERRLEATIAVGYVFQFTGRSDDGLEDHAGVHHRGGRRRAAAAQRVSCGRESSLRNQFQGRLRLTDGERRSLAEIGKRLGKQALDEFASFVKPDTILGWHRRLVAKSTRRFSSPRKRFLPRGGLRHPHLAVDGERLPSVSKTSRFSWKMTFVAGFVLRNVSEPP